VELGTVTARDLAGASVQVEVQAQQTALPADRASFSATALDALTAGQLSPIRLGRIVAELVFAQAEGWPMQLPPLLEGIAGRVSPTAATETLAAFLASGFFDAYGELREAPRGEVVRPALALEAEEGYQVAFAVLDRLLKAEGAEFPYPVGR
jgi:hypothetical protein